MKTLGIRLKIMRRMGLILFLILLANANVMTGKAASGTIQLSTSSTSAKVGDTISVTIKVTANAGIGSLETYVTYDSSVVEYSSGSKYISGGNGTLSLIDNDFEDGIKTKQYEAKFKVIEGGSSEIAIAQVPETLLYDYATGSAIAFSKNSVSVNVKEQTVQSSAKLQSLTVKGATLEPAFSSDITSYSVQVGDSVSQLELNTVLEDSNATVIVDGNSNFNYGENRVTLTVTSSTGEKKNYVIIVTKLEDSVDEVEGETVEEGETTEATIYQNLLEQGVLVTNEDEKVVLMGLGRIELTDLQEETLIPEGYIESSIKIGTESITVYVQQDDLSNDFMLVYGKGVSGEEGFYWYDRVEHTIQRYEESHLSMVNNVVEQQEENSNQKVMIMGILIVILVAIILVLIMVVIQLFLKRKSNRYDRF